MRCVAVIQFWMVILSVKLAKVVVGLAGLRTPTMMLLPDTEIERSEAETP